ncbi:MAG: hypothetical protein GXO42_02255 [bacterium]|nr:hypothetical protein [bacterium]
MILAVLGTAFIASLTANLFYRFLVKEEATRKLAEKLKEVESLLQKAMKGEFSYEELQTKQKEVLKDMLTLYFKQSFAFLAPFFLGLAALEVLHVQACWKVPVWPLPASINTAWIYILAYAAFNALLGIFLLGDYAKTLAA